VEGAVRVVAARWIKRRLTRMGMHQAMREELNEQFNARGGDTTWPESNLLAGIHLALEDLWEVYRALASSGRTPSGAYEATSLMRPCNGLKRGLRSERVGRGVRSEPRGSRRRGGDPRAPSPYQRGTNQSFEESRDR